MYRQLCPISPQSYELLREIGAQLKEQQFTALAEFMIGVEEQVYYQARQEIDAELEWEHAFDELSPIL
ncbi:MAG TPA: hypothetical protein VGD98_15240 [Ktedonobacteraceae bacterium]